MSSKFVALVSNNWGRIDAMAAQVRLELLPKIGEISPRNSTKSLNHDIKVKAVLNNISYLNRFSLESTKSSQLL